MIIFREDSQTDFAEENVLFKVSLRPVPHLHIRSIPKSIISLSVLTSCYRRRVNSSLGHQVYVMQRVVIGDRERYYRSIQSLSKLKRLV